MDLYITNLSEKDCACDALILPLPDDKPQSYDGVHPSLSGVIKKALSKEFQAKRNEVFLFSSPEGMKPERVLLAGLGPSSDVSPERLRQAGGKSAAYLRDMGMKKIALSTRVISSLGFSPSAFAEGALLGLYTFGRYRKEEKDRKEVSRFTILSKPSGELKKELDWTRVIASSVAFARDLINTPSNDMTPSHLAKAALTLKKKNLSVKVLGRKDAKKLGMESYLSVAKGSHEPPQFIVLEYKGAKGAPVVLIGKSITFDSGGISLKPSEGMEKMKYDMAGGAAVLGVLKAVSESGLPVHVIGILPATENLPGGSASRPGDVVRAIGGITIEIISTDAEGRMAIADALGYAKRFRPRAIIDIATLTGACPIALGNEAIAMMGNDRELMERLKTSSDATYERVWEMPLFEEYKDYVKSDIADLKNSGGRNGSLVTSGWFLSEFAGDTPWVHLDIAGTAWMEKDKPYIPKGASGFGVRLLSDFLRGL